MACLRSWKAAVALGVEVECFHRPDITQTFLPILLRNPDLCEERYTMPSSSGYPPKTAIELQDMDSQSRLRQKAGNVSDHPLAGGPSATDDQDPIRAKLSHATDEDAESLDDDGFDVISYWAIGASAW